MLIMSLGIFFYNTILNQTEYPVSAIAAYSTCHRIEHLFFIPIISLATSMVTLIGMFYGAKKFNLLNIILLIIRTLIIFFIIIMISRPIYKEKYGYTLTEQSNSIVLIEIDNSFSMYNEILEGNIKKTLKNIIN